MNASIISIGDELLIGQVIDTNAAWLGQELNKTGIKVQFRLTVGDDESEIINALNIAKQKSQLILITGGLGPTKDDLTKQVLCNYFGCKIIFNEEIYSDIKTFFERSNRPMIESNRQQAEVPDCCIPLRNRLGTAPGMWFEKEGKVFVSMPGVPFEMKAMIENDVLPMLKKKFTFPAIVHRTILTVGIGESFLAEKISDWENTLPRNLKLAYLPNLSQVRLRISAYGGDESALKQEIKKQEEKLLPLLGKYVYGFENDTLEKVIGEMLKDRSATLCTAESCTGGYIAHRITSVPGSSGYFKGSVVSYANEIKENFIGVKKETIEQRGAVSEQTVTEMAQGVLRKMNTDYSIAVSGIAGPDGGTKEKPVGLVWVAVGTKQKTVAKQFQFFRNRQMNIEMTGIAALNMLRLLLIDKFEE